jgi:hypothetical protein
MNKIYYNKDKAIQAMEFAIEHQKLCSSGGTLGDLLSKAESIYKFISGECEFFEEKK